VKKSTSSDKSKVVSINSKASDSKVLSLISKLEKRTEKQMAGFVKEIVRLQKNHAKLEEKLGKAKATPAKVAKKIAKAPKKKMRQMDMSDA